METTTRRLRRPLRVLLAALLCLACVPVQALVGAGEAWASSTELYAVVYKEAGQKNYTLVFQNTPDAQGGYGMKKAHYTPQTKWWSGLETPGCYGRGLLVSEIDKDYPIGRTVALPGTSAPDVVAIQFRDCDSLTTVDLRNLNTPDLQTLYDMFRECPNLQTANLQGFNAGSAREASSMFCDCFKLESADLRNMRGFSFIAHMGSAFHNAGRDGKQLTIDMRGTDTSSVTTMGALFLGAGGASGLSIRGLDTSNATDMGFMFHDANLTAFDLSFLDTSSARNMQYMFHGTTGLTDADLRRMDTSNVTDMEGLFSGADLRHVTVIPFDTSSVRNMQYMFQDATIKSLDLTGLDTSNVTDMSSMFYNTNIKGCKFGSMDTSSVTTMDCMFCFDDLRGQSLKFLKDTSAVESMEGMFNMALLEGCDLSHLDTSSVKNMNCMFCFAQFTKLDLTAFDVSKVQDMTEMFACTGAASFGPGKAVNTRGWRAISLKSTCDMFGKASYASIVLPEMAFLPGADASCMFYQCDVRTLDLSRLDSRNVDRADSALSFSEDYDPNTNTSTPLVGSLRQITLGAKTQLGKYLPTSALWRNSKGKVLKASQIPSYKADTYTAITATKMSQASISVPSKTYTGKTIKPSSVAVKLGGIALNQGTDFTVSCAGGKKVGSYKVTVKGKSPFSGTKTTTFKILPKGTSVSRLTKASKGFTATWKKPSAAARSQIDGYQVRYATASNMKGAKTVTVKGAAKTSAKVGKLKGGKTYYVQVRSYKKAGSTTYYSDWSKTKTVKTKK